jgi:hypothetical protein
LESFRETIQNETEFTTGLIALSFFGQQARQAHRRSELQGERRLFASDLDGLG